MKRLYALTLLFAAAAASPAFGQKAADVERPLRQHVHYLASDDLEGRRRRVQRRRGVAGCGRPDFRCDVGAADARMGVTE